MSRQEFWSSATSLLLALTLLLVILLQSGCAALVPNTITPEFEHMSHASQHFGPPHTNYGANMANIVVQWDVSKSLHVSAAEGLELDRHWSGTNSNGEIIGPREEFSLRVGYSFKLR